MDNQLTAITSLLVQLKECNMIQLRRLKGQLTVSMYYCPTAEQYPDYSFSSGITNTANRTKGQTSQRKLNSPGRMKKPVNGSGI